MLYPLSYGGSASGIPSGPPAERGELSGAEWTQQHYQCAASSGQMTGTRRAATGTRGHRSASKTHWTGAPTDTRRERRRCARNTWWRARHRPARNTTPQAPQEEHMATGTLADTGPARYRRPGRNTVPRAPGRHGTSTPQAPRAEHSATGTQADTGRARYRRPRRNTVPRAPRPTRDEHAAGAPGGTHGHGHPGRYGTSMPLVRRRYT